MKVVPEKQFLDRLSSVLCHHRVCDFTRVGIPNKRLEQAQRPRERAIVEHIVQPPAVPAAQVAPAQPPAQPPAQELAPPVQAAMHMGVFGGSLLLAVR